MNVTSQIPSDIDDNRAYPNSPVPKGVARIRRAALTAAAAVSLLLAVAGATAATASASPSRATTPAATGQCAVTYVPVGSDRSYSTWFFGRTVVRFVNPSHGAVDIQWWSGPSSDQIHLVPGQSLDLVRSFAGLRLSIHVAGNYGSGVNVSFPYGPC